ncbi:MAG: SGNH/GDSL hydrolase family protein [Acidobacteriota bacterium]|nr:SGNH/GDSL hydrolase family protein [Acidobacteriota bacterium]MDH3522887.1 SGNH/GDSL hydrolase family protein [Acidobacteriota bacterium]
MTRSRRTPAWVPLAVAAALALATATGARAQMFRYMCFGDSITEGNTTFDPTGLGGYPGRLPALIDCDLPACKVVNKGKGGEETPEGVTRIEAILNTANWDVVLLMEGTNDVFNNTSNNTIEANLGIMDDKARDHGVDTLHASIIHLDPDSTAGNDPGKVAAVANLRTRVMNLAAARNRWFADPWTPLCPNQACFEAHYHDPPGAVGHPDPSGFDILAGVFEDAIESSPVPGYVTAVYPIGVIDDPDPTFLWIKEASGVATWYEFRLLSGTTTLEEGWYEEDAVCAGTQCSLDFGSLPEGDYTWEVRGRNPRGRSNWRSTPFTIQTLLPPTGVTLTAPLGFIGEPEPTFTWDREAPRAATSYRLEVAGEGGIILDQVYPLFGTCGADTCAVDPFAGAPLAAGPYSWRVRGANAAGDGPWSEPGLFELVPGLVFADGFESGDTAAWSVTVP